MPQHELLACAQCGCFAFSCFEDFSIRANSIHDRELATLGELQAWFRSGDSDSSRIPMEGALHSLWPSVDVLASEIKSTPGLSRGIARARRLEVDFMRPLHSQPPDFSRGGLVPSGDFDKSSLRLKARGFHHPRKGTLNAASCVVRQAATPSSTKSTTGSSSPPAATEAPPNAPMLSESSPLRC